MPTVTCGTRRPAPFVKGSGTITLWAVVLSDGDCPRVYLTKHEAANYVKHWNSVATKIRARVVPRYLREVSKSGKAVG